MFVFVYSSYQLNLSFPYQVVILTTQETPKNIFFFNNNIMNDNSKRPLEQEKIRFYFIRRTTRPGYAGITTNL